MAGRTRSIALVGALCSLSGAAFAQVTQHSLTVGSAGALGCQGTGGPVLSNGTPASALLDFTYDDTTHELMLVVTNDSPVTVGEPNPILTRVAFMLPLGSVDGATLMSQVGSGGATPAFSLAVDKNPGNQRQLKMGCFGYFSALLDTQGVFGIANAAAGTIAAPASKVTTGPVTFKMVLTGPGVDLLTARIIAVGFSQHAPWKATNAVCKFQAGGPGGAGSGFISVVEDGGCLPNFWISSLPRIGSTISVCVGGAGGCHGCLLGSFYPGPTVVAGITIPIGLPIAFAVVFNGLPVSSLVCTPYTIPLDPTLVGQTIYFTVVTPGSGPEPSALFESSPRFDITFVTE